MWYVFNKLNKLWIPISESDKIEEEYQKYITDTQMGQLVYHCFGDGLTACINFDKMETYCGSGRCLISHERNKMNPEHMTFKLQRRDL